MIPLKWRSTRQQPQPLKGQLFTFENFPVSRLVIFLVVKLTTVRRWRGKPPQKKSHHRNTEPKEDVAPPKKNLLKMVKLYTWVEETRETLPLWTVLRFFRFPMGFFSGRWGCFWGWKKLQKMMSLFHDFRPNFEENATFLKGWGIKSL